MTEPGRISLALTEFPSGIDRWMLLIMSAVVLAAAMGGIFYNGVSLASGLSSLLVAIIVAALFLTLVVPRRYQLEAEHLVIQSGLFARRIPYTEITSVEASQGPWKRVRISRGAASMFLNPINRAPFIRALRERVGLARERMTPAAG